MKGKDNYQNPATKVYKTIDIIADMSSWTDNAHLRGLQNWKPRLHGVIKDSWVDANRPKEGDTLSELLDDASDDEKAISLTVLLHGLSWLKVGKILREISS